MAGKPGRSLCQYVALLLNLLELAAQLDQLLASIDRQRVKQTDQAPIHVDPRQPTHGVGEGAHALHQALNQVQGEVGPRSQRTFDIGTRYTNELCPDDHLPAITALNSPVWMMYMQSATSPSLTTVVPGSQVRVSPSFASSAPVAAGLALHQHLADAAFELDLTFELS